tara:strand:+ start:238 stop:768 length:531 start_codon:yes stop_codon:yes gene_type:complete
MQSKISGLILKSQHFFESDKLIELFSPTQGKLKCLVKSAQKSKSNFGGKLDPLCIIDAETFQGKSFLLITQCSLKSDFSSIRTEFNTLQLALFFLSIIQVSTEFNQPNTALYNLLISHLTQLSKHYHLETIKQSFYKQYLQVEGLYEENKIKITDTEFINLLASYTHKKITLPLQI